MSLPLRIPHQFDICNDFRQMYLFVVLGFVFLLSACGGGSGDLGSASNATPSQPENLSVQIGKNTVILSWDDSSDTVAYEVCRAEESIIDVTYCLNYSGGVLYQNITNNIYTITGLENGTQYYFTVIAINSDDADGTSSTEITATPYSLINDTGLTTCGDYSFDNSGNDDIDLDCSNSTDSDGDPIPPNQDALYGNDSENNDDSDGTAGFSFTKLDENGDELDVSATSWSCVQDNVTGLIWEVKTDDDGLHDKDDTYTWYNSDTELNFGVAGTADNGGDSCYGYDSTDSDTFCNTESFVSRVNETSLCGSSSWRLPTIQELINVSDYGTSEPIIDVNYFPNTATYIGLGSMLSYWSNSNLASTTQLSKAYTLNFINGYQTRQLKSSEYYVRLVSGSE